MLAAVEAAGAVAAITAVVCGVATLGLDAGELQRFLDREGIRKVSSRDLGIAIAEGADGATTVAASLAIASRLGVRVFATGGIGGVHRELPGASIDTWVRDESADLLELARTPMVVVSAGPKAILDVRATWERLDTLGIPVVGFRTRELPAFYSAGSGIRLTASADDAGTIADIADAHFGLGRSQAVLVVQPPPDDVAIPADVIEPAVRSALALAAKDRVSGGAVTPFLLDAVSSATKGQSLDTNLGLLESNARLAAEIAVALSRAERSGT